MSFPTLQVRPNEKNPKILRSHEFLRQSNQLVERNLINTEGRKMLAKMLTKTVAEVKGIYALDEKRAELAKSGKLLEKLKSAHQTSMGIMEDRFVLADLARQVQEKKLDVQRNYYECDHLRKSVQSTNAEIRREREVNEKRLSNTTRATGELMSKSASILKLLENSTDVCKLRSMEEDKKVLVEEVNYLRKEKKLLAEDIRCKKATLKSESRKSFQKTVIECAKHYTLCQSLTPKLLKSKKSLELLKDEEESRRACGSLDETMQFDRSFVLASMDKEKSPDKKSDSPPVKDFTSHKSSSKSSLFNESVSEHTMDVEDPMEESTHDENAEKTVVVPVSAPDTVIEPVKQAQSLKRYESMVETQRVLPRDLSPEPDHESIELEEQADKSIDVMEIEKEDEEERGEDVGEMMEQEEATPSIFENQDRNDAVPATSNDSVSSVKSGVSPKTEAVQKQMIPEVFDADGQINNAQNDTEMRTEEDVLSENGSNRSNNLSFNFFGNTKGGNNGDGNASGIDSDGNFDFNFGGGDDGSSNGSGGAFDFLNCGGEEDGPGSSSNPSDPFGFGSNAGGSGGDMSFNFNFDGDNEGGNSGTGGNSGSFFNF